MGAPFNYSKKAKTDGWQVVPNAHTRDQSTRYLLKHVTEFKVTQMENKSGRWHIWMTEL